MSDYTIFVENQAQVFLGGPPLVKMATGEIVDAETLGGAKMHATVTGLADQIATDEYGVTYSNHYGRSQFTYRAMEIGLMRYVKLETG